MDRSLFSLAGLFCCAFLFSPARICAEEQRIRCESPRKGEVHCPARTQGRVELLHRLSRSPCIEGRTWGYDRNEVWVADGCRAEFIVGRRRPNADDDRPSRGDAGRYVGRKHQVVKCESPGRRYQRCPIRIEGHVELLEQYSSADCIEDRSWGYDRNGIWVDRGCRAKFRVGERRRH